MSGALRGCWDAWGKRWSMTRVFGREMEPQQAWGAVVCVCDDVRQGWMGRVLEEEGKALEGGVDAHRRCCA